MKILWHREVRCVYRTRQKKFHLLVWSEDNDFKIMSFPDKAQRQYCWDARDQYWSCLDKNAPQHQPTSGSDEPKVCLQFRKLYMKECPGQWWVEIRIQLTDLRLVFTSLFSFQRVKHFDRKRTYEQFKEKMAKGYDPTSETKWVHSVCFFFVDKRNRRFT